MSPHDKEERYDNIQIVKMSDGTTIEGHDAVKQYLEEEAQLSREHGATLFFQVYKINLDADNIQDFHGRKLTEFKLAENFVSANDTVAAVKRKIRLLLDENPAAQPALADGDHVTFSFNGHSMKDERLFYADHFMMLPAWIQVVIHGCEFEELLERMSKLSQRR